jgi:hypothetical protein
LRWEGEDDCDWNLVGRRYVTEEIWASNIEKVGLLKMAGEVFVKV